MSVEGVLLKVLTEVAQLTKQSNHISTTEPITEESPVASSPPRFLGDDEKEKNLLRKIKIIRSPRREQERQKLSACRQRTTVIWTDPNS
ncbi:hypothetical protein TELCIR_24253 [Teladorsagia circumcincta]|uniref:Uncharacterized protein n=1 Tax=Teladorsagia circumcincta TaxID=45464 RepID=A0A2G9T900_TELCI|nr:hypothetical protein TELCIR_24253 [Teladorsagia circumcincta]